MASVATQKFGSEYNVKRNTVVTWSVRLYWCVAEYTPMGIEIKYASIKEMPLSWTDTGIRSLSLSHTGR